MATPVGTRWGDVGLPVELTSFVGRQQEIGAVKAALSEARVVTLTGVGGVGKTRLAMRVATGLRRAFSDGVRFLDLSSVSDRSALGSAVVETLEIHDQSGRDETEIITEFLRERQMLLVFDNCEQVVEECATLINAVIRQAPQVRVLATSRERLWVTGEHVWRVPPLSVPASDPESDEEFARSSPGPPQYPALVLFAERAAAVGGAALIRDDWPDVARLCRRLDGLPLAIELAAVQTRLFTPGQLVRGFEERLGSLGTPDRTAPARHRSLEAAIDWSYELCSPQEQLLWARASVFAGWFDLDAAEGVCSGEDLLPEAVMALVAGLLDKSVLVQEEHHGQAQYRLLETLAHYGRNRLRDTGQEAELVRRHRDWYLQLAEDMAAQWYGPDQLSWSRRLRRGYRNVRAAMEYCLSTPGEEHAGLRFTAALLQYWHGSGQMTEGRAWLERALAANREPTPARATSLRNLASICAQQQDLAAAEAAREESLALAGRLHDPLLNARALAVGAELALCRGDFVATIAHAREALSCPEYAGGPERAASLTILTVAHAMLGNYDEVVSAFEQAQRCTIEFGERFNLSWTLIGRAVAEYSAGENISAITYLREAMRIAHEFNNPLCLSTALGVMLCSTAADGDVARAAVLLGARRRICRVFGISDFVNDNESALVDSATSQISQGLGEALFKAGVARGFAFDLDNAVGYALGAEEEPAPAAEASTTPAEPNPLTAREQQVAELVAQGMSNKQIAAKLVISPRTVEGHVDHVLTKLGFTSRAHVAAWASRHGKS
ncbi:LuxR C-terminal-related transcriptional regulator [Streptomyces sp. ZAF1911]|uniref:LuxR C-terminal-related transcriptional regulator n=1 Tax=Streptomyces sp. ZAF1911 TaxID=2944129 RepID=UPI00237B9507|nr:LuxR C-terminal-related transcriptional regulator [Streptomyces sp. ZAF1911]MDD9375946.1 LuxR C-terminal-related transcriptional regulator [Streptomyces sp. ZAF1911]